jgi:hypothetical protein
MAINKETQVSASVVLDKNVYKKISCLAQTNKRSASAQMAFMLEEYMKIIETEKNKS